MASEATAKVEDVGGNGEYQRFYVQKALAGDSLWPFNPGQRVRMQLVETTCDRHAVVVTPATLEVELELTELEIQRTTQEAIQQELSDLEDVEGRAES